MKRTPLKRRTRLSPVSDKRRREGRIYSKLRAEYLSEHPFCEATLRLMGCCAAEAQSIAGGSGYYYNKSGTLCRAPRATDIHHVHKRGRNYLNTDTWMAVCREMHQAIHNSPAWARENGLLA
jgi:hypothetical protein